MACLTLEQILAAEDRSPVRVDVPEWGGHVYVRAISGTQRGELEAWQTANDGPIGLDAKLVALSLCDESGTPLALTEQHVDALSEKSSIALARILAVVAKLSRVTPASVEDAAKN